MPARNAEAIRPGSLLKAWSIVWKVTANDTLSRTLDLKSVEGPQQTKRIRYAPGQEIFLRWEPFTH